MAKAIIKVDIAAFKAKALQWAQQFKEICFLDSNEYADEYSAIEGVLAVKANDIFTTNNDAFRGLENFKAKHSNSWMFGFFSYDLKNEIENLATLQPNRLNFPDVYFFVPEIILFFNKTHIEIHAEEPYEIVKRIKDTKDNFSTKNNEKINIQNRLSKEEYVDTFNKMLDHIKRGDIYEVNLTQEFYVEKITIDPITCYNKLNRNSPSPFSTFFKIKDKFILSSSPERFLAKRGQKLISQPIKGTAPRGKDLTEDNANKLSLLNTPKEIAENVMIVDLVRNDMTRSAKPGTVNAQKKLEVHSFKQVHQLISTITCIQNPNVSDVEVIKNAFPPGSMTGAPKVSAMQICDRYENSRRGVYSGAVGYFSPSGNFDFNVVIRTILYNATKKYLSFHTGGAITIDSNAEAEYNECLLKASGILKTLTQ